MIVQEVFHDGLNEAQINESLAIAKIRREIKRRSNGPKPTVTVIQSPENKSHYLIYANESGKTSKTEMKNGKFSKGKRMSANAASSELNELKIQGWTEVDARSWTQKYKTQIIFGLTGLVTASGFAAAGMLPVYSVLVPLVVNAAGIFTNIISDQIKNPLGMYGGPDGQ